MMGYFLNSFNVFEYRQPPPNDVSDIKQKMFHIIL